MDDSEPPGYRPTKDPESCLSQINDLIKYISSYSHQFSANFKSILATMCAIEKDVENMPVRNETKRSLQMRLNSPLRLHELRRGAMSPIPGLCPKPIPIYSKKLLAKYPNYRPPL